MSRPYENNMGNSAVLSIANAVINQYGQPDKGYIGAEANWKEVFDSRQGIKAENEQYQIFNIQTALGNYALPSVEEGDERKLAILGRITWGIGGARMQADFDWKLGTQLSVPATFVRIEAAYSETEFAPTEVRVFAMFASGSRAARAQVTRTFPQLVVTGDGEGSTAIVIFPIPPMAQALNIFAGNPEFYDAGVAQVRFVGGVGSDYSSASTDLASFVTDGQPFLQAVANEDGVRFPEAAKFVEISTTEDESYLITPSFTLNL